MIDNSIHAKVCWRVAAPFPDRPGRDRFEFSWDVLQEICSLTSMDLIEVYKMCYELIETSDRLYFRKAGIEEVKLCGDGGYLRVDHTYTVYMVEMWNWRSTDWAESYEYVSKQIENYVAPPSNWRFNKKKESTNNVPTSRHEPRAVASFDEGRFQGLDRE